MSRETMQWLNTMTLIGFTEKRGKAWHYKATVQGEESNHYEQAVPIEDVHRRLFNWKAVEVPASVQVRGYLITDPDKKFIVRPVGSLGDGDTGAILSMFSEGYQIHPYDEWLLEQVSLILDDSLSIGSAGLLRGGGQAWVSVEVPENFKSPSDIEFRPNLLAATSLDGSMSTTYKRCITNVVCDNTMSIGLGESGQEFKVRHTRHSNNKLTDIRAALELVHHTADQFLAHTEKLTNIDVSNTEFHQFLELDPTTAYKLPNGAPKEGAGLTRAENKRGEMWDLWFHDSRVAPWKNTAWGVVQSVNTYQHHKVGKKYTDAKRAESNMRKTLTGGFDQLDRQTLSTLDLVLA